MRTRVFSMGLLTAASLALAACGGGGGGGSAIPGPQSTPTPGVTIPGPGNLNAFTTYTVFQGTLNGATYIEVDPYGLTPQTLAAVSAVPGAIVTYPDGSVQIADTLGNFDASQSSYGSNPANINAVQTNPEAEPEVIVAAPSISGAPPVDAFVSIYSAQQNVVNAGARRFGSSPSADLAGLTVLPRGYALYDSEQRVYRVAGRDTDGKLVDLTSGGYTVKWSVALPQGCSGSPAGSLTTVSGDQTKVVYSPPKTGTFTSGCQDLVVASVNGTGATVNASGNAFYYDPSTAATFKGNLTNSTGAGQAGGVVDLYGGGREFWHGKLFAVADASGNFTRLVPPNRTLYPFAGNPVTAGGKTTYSFFTVTPSSVSITGAGTTVMQNLAETTTPAVNPFKPLPPLAQAIRDSSIINAIGFGDIPFGGVNANGSFPAGSLEAIVSSPGPANATGSVTNGAYRGWKFAWDATGTKAVFVQPAAQEGGRHAIEIDTGVVTMAYAVAFNGSAASTSCPSGAACFNFSGYYNPSGFGSVPAPIPPGGPGSGAILAQDGSSADTTGSTFTIGVTRNEYSVGHQTAGSPLYTHQVAITQAPGSTIAFTDSWLNNAGSQLASYTGTRTVGTAPVLFTYSGSGTRTLYKPDGKTVIATIAFTLTNGQINDDRSGGFNVTYTGGFPNASDNGTSVTWTLLPPGQANVATGTVQNPNIMGLQTADVATFAQDSSKNVTVTTDPNLGGNTFAFHL